MDRMRRGEDKLEVIPRSSNRATSPSEKKGRGRDTNQLCTAQPLAQCGSEPTTCVSVNEVSARKVRVKTFQCHWCDKLLSSPAKMSAHILEMHTNHTYDCRDCCKKYKYRGNLNSHVRSVHLRKSSAWWACSMCDKFYVSFTNYNIHFLSNHAGLSYNCYRCPRRFFRPQNLQAHMEKHHPHCIICGEKHVLRACRHCQNQFFKCSKSFHDLVCPGRSTFHCVLCLFSGSTQVSLYEHRLCTHRQQ